MGDNILKVGMISLGCPKNQVDAELMLAKVKNKGFKIVQEPGLSDVVIINTCGFIESAKAEAIEEILEMAKLKEEKRIKKIIVTGCLAERYRDQLAKEFPEIDAVLGIAKNNDIVEAINSVILDQKVVSFDDVNDHDMEGERVLTTLPYFAYLRIADGCDVRCSFCAIPDIRGHFRSKSIDSLIKEAELLAANGVKEIILVAQDTTNYGVDLYGRLMLPELLNRLCEIDGLKWIRILYCYPERMTDELIDVIANREKIVKYIDIPIQHSCDNILKKMNRRETNADLRNLFRKLKDRIPNVVLRTTVITGFPDESEDDFNSLAEFLDEVRFDRLGAFAYSEEEGTPAAKMKNQIEKQIRLDRAEIITEQQAIRMAQDSESKIGTEIEVLVEGFDKYAECYFGRSYADAPDIDGKVFITFDKENKPEIGTFARIKVEDVMDYDLIGKYICTNE